MSVLDILEEAADAVEQHLGTLPMVRTEQIGLDGRAGKVWVDTEGELIIVNDNWLKTLNYYGGFEYVHKDYVYKIGQYTIFSSDNDRVQDCLEYYQEHHENKNEGSE